MDKNQREEKRLVQQIRMLLAKLEDILDAESEEPTQDTVPGHRDDTA